MKESSIVFIYSLLNLYSVFTENGAYEIVTTPLIIDCEVPH